MSPPRRGAFAPFDRKTLVGEAMAGLPGAIGSVPDGMAASLLAGVNPIYGLYASMAGPIAGGLFASTSLVVVTTTSAAALAAGSTLADISPAERPGALFLLTILAGVLMVLAGILRLGRYTRFVANSVMVGFLTGIAVNIVLGQIPAATGAVGEGSIALTRAIDVLLHPDRIDLPTLAVTLSSFAILLLASRTAFRSVAALAALVIPSLIVALVGAQSVATVERPSSFVTSIATPPDRIRQAKSPGAPCTMSVSPAAKDEGAPRVTVQAIAGSPSDVLLEAAADFGADCIVVGSKGLTSHAHFVLGSVASNVAHHAPCDVLIVH